MSSKEKGEVLGVPIGARQKKRVTDSYGAADRCAQWKDSCWPEKDRKVEADTVARWTDKTHPNDLSVGYNF